MREVADQLAFEVADSLRRIIQTDALGPTIRHAVLDDFAPSLRVAERRDSQLKAFDLILPVPLAKMLSWSIQHFPTSAQWYVGKIMSEVDKQLHIPAQVTGEALRRSATTNGELDEQAAQEFFSRVVPREPESRDPRARRRSTVTRQGAISLHRRGVGGCKTSSHLEYWVVCSCGDGRAHGAGRVVGAVRA
ncbi:hypothetical protein ACIHAR_37215, partial [Streptomyces sp. NPDC052016]